MEDPNQKDEMHEASAEVLDELSRLERLNDTVPEGERREMLEQVAAAMDTSLDELLEHIRQMIAPQIDQGPDDARPE